MSDAKKPSLALVVAEKGKSDEDGPDSAPGRDEEHQTACDELADVLGVPEAKRESFCEALDAFISTRR